MGCSGCDRRRAAIKKLALEVERKIKLFLPTTAKEVQDAEPRPTEPVVDQEPTGHDNGYAQGNDDLERDAGTSDQGE